MEELYAYVQKILPALKRVEELNLNGLEPTTPITSSAQLKPGRSRLPGEKRKRVRIERAPDRTEDLCYLSAAQLGRLIKKREISPVEVTEAHLSRIKALEPKLNSFITLLPDQAMAAARKAEKEILRGRCLGPLHGIPFGLKDLFYVKGVRNTSGSKIFDHFVPDFDSTIALRLKEAGAILLGKLNLHPLAYGVTGENEEYGHMHNPWNPDLITGGSSGGSGSAVASGECTFAMGTDTGGSIRIPGALCGLVGLKPTYGRLSRYGITVLAWSQDHPGPMARTVEDCALILNAVAGYDPNDPVSVKLPVPDYTKALRSDARGLRVGVVKEYFELPIEPQVKECSWRAMEKLKELGATISEVSLPIYPYATSIASVIQMVEATAYHARLIRENGPRIYSPVRLRLEAGIFISGTDYVQAERARTLFYARSHDLFKGVDLLAGPTLPVPAFPIGTSEVKIAERTVNIISLMTQYTRPFNLNGFPAITVPCGFSAENLPIGLQLVGRPFEEETVVRAAYAYEQAAKWYSRRPPI
ncbi:MAG: aspartyl/glutamyl-tRNA amidotransferase subunit A [Syntrophaceae bacterium]|nr:aspartyl/glutamyl-tRNA amidotransferase subunit A [Syntrophaceae bacterium]